MLIFYIIKRNISFILNYILHKNNDNIKHKNIQDFASYTTYNFFFIKNYVIHNKITKFNVI